MGFLTLLSLGLLLVHRFQLMQYNAQLYEINTHTVLNENKLEQRLSLKTNIWPLIGFFYSNTNFFVCVRVLVVVRYTHAHSFYWQSVTQIT